MLHDVDITRLKRVGSDHEDRSTEDASEGVHSSHGRLPVHRDDLGELPKVNIEAVNLDLLSTCAGRHVLRVVAGGNVQREPVRPEESGKTLVHCEVVEVDDTGPRVNAVALGVSIVAEEAVLQVH